MIEGEHEDGGQVAEMIQYLQDFINPDVSALYERYKVQNTMRCSSCQRRAC